MPSHAADRGEAWIPTDDNADPGSGLCPRLFFFEWSDPTSVPGGATGNADSEVAIELRIVTDYRAFDARSLAQIVVEDYWDLHDRLFEACQQDEIDGLTKIEELRIDPLDAQGVAHTFRVQYMRARRS
ncbi:MAG: hypothetical protein IPH07_24385 [Deltaproteobacteria bacterium]|nr:hypothetical protein [Deltaproteobacteria bacterium]